ncbi:unnamed protein product [Fraxinus pennsylvanica]|uniref:Holocarboxylase synthetase n=1 Tax=Fraxinus pennsylvanica TaxID=56036 RepID=A0AAD1YW99_9LAMI|nr:unnamed protein product [Fraxinus pennsylvanica]
MAKKRKSDATRLDEVDRTMYSTFCSAANSLSQLYTQATHHQRLSFQAGERQALEKLYNWILRQQEDGARVTTGDIFANIQNELGYGTEEPPSSPRLQFQQQQQSQTAMQSTNTGVQVCSNSFGPATVGQGLRSGNTIFTNALSSPVSRSLQHQHLMQGGYYVNTVTRNNENSNYQSRDPNPPGFYDTSMDMLP